MRIFIYDEGTAGSLRISEIKEYLSSKFGNIQVCIRAEFIEHYLSKLNEELRERAFGELAEKFASIKVRDINKPVFPQSPSVGEINYEKRRISLAQYKPSGILYDGVQYSLILFSMIDTVEITPNTVHIVLTNQLLGTYDPQDRRYHCRSSILFFPSIISTTGIVEAPARPREYYLMRQRYSLFKPVDLVTAELKEHFKGRFIDYEDERMTEVAKGLAMQAILYTLQGEGFCQDKNCRIFNAHWQEDLIYSQILAGGNYCQRHQNMIEEIRISRVPLAKPQACQ